MGLSIISPRIKLGKVPTVEEGDRKLPISADVKRWLMTQATGGCVGPRLGTLLPLPSRPSSGRNEAQRLRCSLRKWLRLPLALWLQSCPWEPVKFPLITLPALPWTSLARNYICILGSAGCPRPSRTAPALTPRWPGHCPGVGGHRGAEGGL